MSGCSQTRACGYRSHTIQAPYISPRHQTSEKHNTKWRTRTDSKHQSDCGGFYISNRKSFGARASPRSLFVVIRSDVQERVHVHSAALFRSLVFSAKYRLALLTLSLLALSALVQIPREKVALGTTGERSAARRTRHVRANHARRRHLQMRAAFSSSRAEKVAAGVVTWCEKNEREIKMRGMWQMTMEMEKNTIETNR